jgi:hypothetical protein
VVRQGLQHQEPGWFGTQPIGFGAISALSVKTAPFDVTFGNFTGASINAVTKSGSKTSGALYTSQKIEI